LVVGAASVNNSFHSLALPRRILSVYYAWEPTKSNKVFYPETWFLNSMAWVDGRRERLPPREILISALGGKCEVCGAVSDLQIHHRVPLAAGGTNQLSNLAVLCRVCHRKETAAFAKVGRLRGSDGRPLKMKDSLTQQHGRELPGENIGEPYWFEGTELFRFDDEAALAHLWRTTAVSTHWKADTIQKRHDQRCPLTNCPLRGRGVISLLERQSRPQQKNVTL
jgi:hypothetical protein